MLAVTFLISNQEISAQSCFITKSGSKYHKATCSYLRNSAQAIKVSEAMAKGYSPCSRCNPNTHALKALTSSYYTQKYANTNYGDRTISKCTTVQCTGTTQKGKRCRNKTKSCKARCHHHD